MLRDRPRLTAFGVLAFLSASAACGKPDVRPADAGGDAASSVDSAIPAPMVDSSEAEAEPTASASATGRGALDLDAYASAGPVWGKSIGHTSVVFKLKLEGGIEAAYKPRSRRGKARYRGEIAAYRLGRALGISNVPPAIPRSFPAAALRAVLGDKDSPASKLYDAEVVPSDHGEVRGALIPWIVGLKFLALESEPKRSEWRGWLSGSASIPPDKLSFAAQISTMVVFDYLTGNWDRWSGGNVGADETGQKVLFIDNDGAFFDPPPPEPLAKQRALVRDDHRFSKSFIGALRTLEPSVAKTAMGDDEPGEPLLSTKMLSGLEERRKDVLTMVDAKIAKEGESAVLPFD